MSHPFATLTPDLVLDAVESIGFLSDARVLALNSYENRVYQVGIEDSEPLIAKFYRPQRWTNEAILEEHRFTFELAELDVPVVAPMIQTKVLNLPSVAKATAAQEPPLIVEMDAQGALRLSQANGTQQFTDTTQLIGTLQQSLHNKPQPVVLAADKAVAYGDVMRVMDALKSAQIERVGLLLKQSQTTQ